MPGADVIYTLFPFGLVPEQVLTWFALFMNAGSSFG
jgi:hypothetical protein